MVGSGARIRIGCTHPALASSEAELTERLLTITFSEDASTATYAAVLHALEGWTVDLKAATGYPESGVIATASEHDGLKVYEADEDGAAITNSIFWVPWEALESVVIL